MADFGPVSKIREVVEASPRGRELLYEHGYDVGQGFVDMLSQYATLEEVAREGRIRDLDRLLQELNRDSR